jgi:ABC-type polysaccharide/polyol phosphate transport system ATPase subunit
LLAFPRHDLIAGTVGDELPVLELDRVCLNIPVVSQETRQLKHVLVRSVTGGAFHKSREGVIIEALKNISCKIFHGDRIALIGHNGAGQTTFLPKKLCYES